jgi:Peptidase M10 serralysin C terminal
VPATPNPNPLPFSGDPLVDALTTGFSWALDASRTLTYSTWNYDGGPGVGPEAEAAVRAAFEQFSNVANVRFQKVGGTAYFNTPADIAILASGNDLDILFGSFYEDRIAGLAIFPAADWGDIWLLALSYAFGLPVSRDIYPKPEGDIFFDHFNRLYFHRETGGAERGVLMHEIGHSLGLKHPHNPVNGHPSFFDMGMSPRNSADGGGLDQLFYTVMSYDQSASLSQGNPQTLMPLDILALQYMYGPNTSFNADNNLYRLVDDGAVRSVWDAGGIDTLDGSASFLPLTMDINPGGLNSVGQYSVVAIAHGVTIENVSGGAGNDRIMGNGAGNVIFGNGGNDVLFGGAGDDAIDAGAGADIVYGEAGSNFLIGGAGGDVFALDFRQPGFFWSTITDFSRGGVNHDRIDIYGWRRGTSLATTEQGIVNGVAATTIRFDLDRNGVEDARLTLNGYTAAMVDGFLQTSIPMAAV